MPKRRGVKQRQNLARISAAGHAASGVGAGSRSSPFPYGFAVEEVQHGSEEGRLRYTSPDGSTFWSTEAVWEHVASSRVTAVIGQAPISCATDDSGSEYFPTPKKGRKINVAPESDVEEEPEAPQNCLFFTELRALDKFMAAVSAYRHCSTEGCKGMYLCRWRDLAWVVVQELSTCAVGAK